jgi:methyl-CpG-binding domain protein 4
MAIIQQEFQHDPWKMLVGCIMLNQTHNRQVREVIYDFFEKYPNPQSINESDREDIVERLRPLGFYNRRANTILRFTHEYINKQFENISELYGIGKYASDSYEIFINGNTNVEPTDKILRRYLNGEFIDQ